MSSDEKDRPTAVLVSLQLPGVTDEEHDADVAELGLLDGVQPAMAGAQGGKVVTRRLEVDPDPFVPIGTIDRAPIPVGRHDTTRSAPVSRR